MTRALCDYLRTRADRCDKVGLTLRDGRDFLGWIVLVDEDGNGYDPGAGEDPDDIPPPGDTVPPRALISWAYSPLAAQAVGDPAWCPDDEWIPLTAVVPDTPAHYDRDATPRWVPFSP
ncbi:hypothetical protein [Streptomyces sp. NPDC058953]|uniref:hypothetical protein n=1 Tax=unclassified Streptomyces TaxID=2593676 RepID=UPI00369B902C